MGTPASRKRGHRAVLVAEVRQAENDAVDLAGDARPESGQTRAFLDVSTAPKRVAAGSIISTRWPRPSSVCRTSLSREAISEAGKKLRFPKRTANVNLEFSISRFLRFCLQLAAILRFGDGPFGRRVGVPIDDVVPPTVHLVERLQHHALGTLIGRHVQQVRGCEKLEECPGTGFRAAAASSGFADAPGNGFRNSTPGRSCPGTSAQSTSGPCRKANRLGLSRNASV